jgi:retron-type reverse transcriptase
MRLYFESNKILTEEQAGFRTKRSCELIVNRIVDAWQLSLDAKENIIAIFLDLSKAFDTVNHSLLLEKLYYYNFSSNAINLIKHYLSNRFMLTKFGKCFSEAKILVDGVPQGSVLGPLLFIIFLNDIGFLDLHSLFLQLM